MRQTGITLAPFYKGWDRYNDLLIEAVAPLIPAQLALCAVPALRPAWFLAAHIIGARAIWFHTVMGQGDDALTDLESWGQDGAPIRTAAELVRGLETTWALIEDCLTRWTPALLDDPFERRGHARTRQWIIWHTLEHDMHHGGELAFTLGMHGLPTPDL